MGKNQHVVPAKNGGWNVKGAGNSKQLFILLQRAKLQILLDRFHEIKVPN